MKIGIPRGLFFDKYETLFIAFFSKLGIDFVFSDKTNLSTIKDANKFISNDCCLSLKIFIGHIYNLTSKCNFIIIPRISSIYKNENVCSNFQGIFDLVNNLFDFNFIDFNIDITNNKSLKLAFIDLGLYLGLSYNDIVSCFDQAYDIYLSELNNKLLLQTNIFNSNMKKVLIVGNEYNICSDFFTSDISFLLKKRGVGVIYSYIYDENIRNNYFPVLISKISFSYYKNIISFISKYKDYVDGVIFIGLSSCSFDSLYYKVCTSLFKNIPFININFDDNIYKTNYLSSIDSFIDTINKENIYG